MSDSELSEVSTTEEALPSIATIQSCKNVLSKPDASATVVKVDEAFAVKFGTDVEMLEAMNMEFVAQNSDAPVPHLYGTMMDAKTLTNYIVMEFVPGQTLDTIWRDLSHSEKRDVVGQIRKALSSLRSMRPPNYIGSINRQACRDRLFWLPADEHDPLDSGPFNTESDMNEGILRRFGASLPTSYLHYVRTLISTTLQNHKIVFTHGCILAKNIMVQRTRANADGTSSLAIKIIDWKAAGWYPDYWEFCNATVAGLLWPEWHAIAQNVLPACPHEYLMMAYIRNLGFY